MRFKLTLRIEKNSLGNLLPINYQYEQSAVIYRILSLANEDYANWLHENGYHAGEKRFKLFTYSRFKIEKRQIIPQEERIRILCDTIEWQISFLPEKSTEKFIQGLFANQVFEVGDKKSAVQFRVQNVEVLPSPTFTEEMEFETMSPICVRILCKDGPARYIPPTDNIAELALQTGLMARYESFYGEPYTGDITGFKFTALSEPKSVLVKIKANTPQQTKVRGYMCQFRLKAPVELMKIMYESGIGEECSQGFGCVRELKKNNNVDGNYQMDK